jgi:hypothetical protein
MLMPQHAKRIIRESWAVMLSRASSDYEFAGGLFPRFCTCPLRPSAERFDLASPAAAATSLPWPGSCRPLHPLRLRVILLAGRTTGCIVVVVFRLGA